MSRQKRIYWIACALVLIGAVAAILVVTLPKKDVIPVVKFDGTTRLSELSQDDCIAFVKSRGLSIPTEPTGADAGKFIKDNIVKFESDPFSPAIIDDTAALKFAEGIRRAVNEYNGVPTLQYGVYEFEKCLYMAPISSYYPFEGTGEKYNISSYVFLIANQEHPDASEKFNMIYWKVQPVDLDSWDEKFQFIDPLDISVYTHRVCYPINDRYQLLLMDGEVWLAKIIAKSGDFWSIYKLKPEK